MIEGTATSPPPGWPPGSSYVIGTIDNGDGTKTPKFATVPGHSSPQNELGTAPGVNLDSAQWAVVDGRLHYLHAFDSDGDGLYDVKAHYFRPSTPSPDPGVVIPSVGGPVYVISPDTPKPKAGCPTSGRNVHFHASTKQCHAGEHACPRVAAGQARLHPLSQTGHGHVTGCHSEAFPLHKCPDGTHVATKQQDGHGHVTCHAGEHDCPAGQHATSRDGDGHVTGCHSKTSPAHECPNGEIPKGRASPAHGTPKNGHVFGCATACKPQTGEHRHAGNNECHLDHPVPTCAERLFKGQFQNVRYVAHTGDPADPDVAAVKNVEGCGPDKVCWALSSGRHRHGPGSDPPHGPEELPWGRNDCHDDHSDPSCIAGLLADYRKPHRYTPHQQDFHHKPISASLLGCVPVCAPAAGEHRHIAVDLSGDTCHAGEHSCPAGQHAHSRTAHGHVAGCSPMNVQCAWGGTAGTTATVTLTWDTTGDDQHDSYEISHREYKWSHLTTPTGSTTVTNASSPYSFTPSTNDVVVETKLIHTEQVVDSKGNLTGAVNTNDSGWAKVWCGAPMPTLNLACAADTNANGNKLTSSTLSISYSLQSPYPATLPYPVKFSFQTQILDWGEEAENWGRSVWSDASHHPVFDSPVSGRHTGEWTGTPPGSEAMDPQLSEPPAPADDATSQIAAGSTTSGQVTVQHRMSGYTYRVWAKTTYWLPGANTLAGHTTGIITESTVTCEASDCVASTVTNRRQVEWNLLFDIYEPAHDAADRPAVHPNAANQNGDPNCCAEQSDSPIGIGQAECTRRCSILATYSYWAPRRHCVHLG